MSVRRAPILGAVAAGLLLVVALAGCTPVVVSESTAVSPPDASAVDFADAFSMDEGRIVANARVGGDPVVYVYDRTPSGWAHSSTLTPGPGATQWWGASVAVSGDTIAIADPYAQGALVEDYGTVHIYDLQGGAWTEVQAIRREQVFTSFAAGVWLSGDGLLIRAGPICDASCGSGYWRYYQRSGGTFDVAYDSFTPDHRRGNDLVAGVDQGRLALGNPGSFEYDYGLVDNNLMVWDSTVVPAALVVDEEVPYGDPYEDPPPGGFNAGWFRQIDLSGELLAYESCCTTDSSLHILRDAGEGYEPEATLSVFGPSAAVSVLPEAVLAADPTVGRWHTYVMRDGAWQHGNEIPAPDAVAGTFAVPPVAVGNDVAVQGDGVLWILTIDPGPANDD